jgi:hypothetical protein
VYSRTRRPALQFNSSSRSRKGSFYRPVGTQADHRLSAGTLVHHHLDRGQRRHELDAGLLEGFVPDAIRAESEDNSSREADSSTSARKGCPSAESTVIRPMPAASATIGSGGQCRSAAQRS